ncbi:phosphoserine phosphatase [Burkholderia sp. Leaf177]|uniref:HAD family hydrolase n=1 Tax=Burkholderia sp. Leaf177 TaxID=1736287 RepID=UPI0006FCD1C2|nr:HAD family hydrolase [Burkholderia sp. Leaf177]KQR76688.1 phosphoserine phosphatase [Burkholderia sp. Leaf177]
MSRTLALFDLDHTLLPLDSDQSWARFYATLGFEGSADHAKEIDAYYQQYAAGKLDMDGYLKLTLAPLARHSRADLDAWHATFMKTVIEPAIRPEALGLVRRHLDAGDLCCIVTATNAFVTAPIAKALGMEHLLAIDLDTEHNDPLGRYTGRSVGVVTFREGKIVRTEQWLASQGLKLDDFKESYFYSDSVNDVPLMERVTHPVATNPDRRLRAIAAERNWPVMELFA